ncbi:AraC family transcriptional regulator [Paenibacillus cymbidii]|uniref:AraC family transcriptional regulator n=1 Tax=Paenibacillus cymbidii TaxID=1639034 RepID=UPI001F192837|nr:AraC family transcriptional regulator [Paenibacillus cymbidii]
MRLDFLYYGSKSAGAYVPFHEHECRELVYYESGQGQTTIGGVPFAFRGGTFALIAPRVAHDERHAADTQLLFIGFRLAEAAAVTASSAVYADDANGTVLQLLLQMKGEFARQQEGYAEMLNLFVGQLSIVLRRVLSGSAGTGRGASEPPDKRLQYARNYMDEHYRQKISVDALADLSGYSYDRFRHLFKELTGLAPLQYLYDKRIAYAQALLLHSSASVSAVAAEAGFVSDAQFCSMFKRETGLTPRAFRIRRQVE